MFQFWRDYQKGKGFRLAVEKCLKPEYRKTLGNAHMAATMLAVCAHEKCESVNRSVGPVTCRLENVSNGGANLGNWTVIAIPDGSSMDTVSIAHENFSIRDGELQPTEVDYEI